MRVEFTLSGIVLLMLLCTLSQFPVQCQVVNYNCGPLESYTANESCDKNCDNDCSVLLAKQCICNAGFLRNRKTGMCIPEDQCFPSIEPITFPCLKD
uniref:Putative salivary secreted peptide with til domain protein n=1 Tax=Anopheles nuneztovari TaxID=30067 RepID=A0A2M3YWI7_9DIPT